eukprot:TRINITY_DN5374_c0_g1_i5.p1 TRINITY_DN5374_c0_g1~~TRINITY_DN5374_c0_g1_i5.p1  ORF type:complete len:194 (+),score=29.80 TRINITY_DN5374_c0_g1_i5:674-1255(+)
MAYVPFGTEPGCFQKEVEPTVFPPRVITVPGLLLPVPSEFLRSFPDNVSLDGELWAGYNSYNKLISIVGRSHRFQDDQERLSYLWRDVEFHVFDVPSCTGPYLQRYSFAKKSISGCASHVHVIPISYCSGLEHLHVNLQNIRKKKGEGIMLYHPASPYTPGRTSTLLKVKGYMEEDVKFIKCNPNSYTFVCEQ